jgi:peptidoglycan/LPS O-acetylase OafA/YrhL
MTRTPQNTARYPALDGLRGIAALAVVGLHVTKYFQLGFDLKHAHLAVDFFFLLSGFVISYAYDRRLAGGLGTVEFLTIRLIRLYPMIVLGIVSGTMAMLASIKFGFDIPVISVLSAAACNALLLPSFAMQQIRPFAFPVDTPLWSLSFEMLINILYAALFAYLTKPRLWVGILFGAVLVGWTSLTYGTLDVGFYWRDFYLGLCRVLFPFLAGVMLCRALGKRKMVSAWGHAACLPMFAILATPGLAGGYYEGLIVLLAFPAILIVAAHAAPAPALDRIWSFLGELSYPIYVVHYPFVVVASTLAHRRNLSGAALDGAALLCFLGILVLASLLLQFYDRPVRHFLKTWFSRRRAIA